MTMKKMNGLRGVNALKSDLHTHLSGFHTSLVDLEPVTLLVNSVSRI